MSSMALACVLAAACVGPSSGLRESQKLPLSEPSPPLACLRRLPAPGESLEAVEEEVPWLNQSVKLFPFSRQEDNFISAALLDGHGWDLPILETLCGKWQAAGHVGNFLDLGANIGTYSIPMASCLRGAANVVSVEAMPGTIGHLSAAIAANALDNVCFYPAAVGQSEGVITMQLNPFNKGQSMVVGNDEGDEPAEKSRRLQAPQEMKVQMTTMNVLLQANPDLKSVMVAKVDIEGNEGRMLKGADRLFSEHPPCYLLIELNSLWLKNAGTPVDQVRQWLRDFGYDNGVVTESSGTHLFAQRDLAACHDRVRHEFLGQR